MVDAYTANDIIICEDYRGEWTLTDFGDGTVASVVAPNGSSNTTTGWNGNSLGAHNEPGRQREATIRLVKASGDDKRLNENYNLWKNRDSRFKPLSMRFTKNVGHSDGTITSDTLECYFGLPVDLPEQKNDTNGDTEQVVSQYMWRFGNSERSLG